jgi:cell division septation protein DedD
MADPILENENEIPKSGEGSEKEPIISPKDNDELIIEIDENQKIEATTKELSPAEEELEPEEEIVEKPVVQANAAQKKHGKHHKPAKPVKPPKEPREPREGGSKKGLYILIAIFAVIGIGGYFFIMQPEMLAKKFPILVEKGIIKTDSTITLGTTPEVKPETPSEVSTTDPQVAPNAIDGGVAAPTKQDEKVTEAITKDLEKETPHAVATAAPAPAPATSTANTATTAPTKTDNSASTTTPAKPKDNRVVKKGLLQTPCFIIGYASISSEATAIKTVATLSTKGQKCGYFWIPDYTPGGPQLFKVYIGPFTTRDDAAKELPTIKADVPGAYISEIK